MTELKLRRHDVHYEVRSYLNPECDGYDGPLYYGIYEVIEMDCDGNVLRVVKTFGTGDPDDRRDAYRMAGYLNDKR